MPKPKPTNPDLKKARDIKVGDMVSYVGLWCEVIAVTPVYLSDDMETVTLVLREVGEPYALPIYTPADRAVKVIC